jgi:hypothetical protein
MPKQNIVLTPEEKMRLNSKLVRDAVFTSKARYTRREILSRNLTRENQIRALVRAVD